MRIRNALTIVLAIAMVLSGPISAVSAGTPIAIDINNPSFEDPILSSLIEDL